MIGEDFENTERGRRLAAQLDCGDGVPTLTLERSEPIRVRRNPAGDEARDLTAKVFALFGTVLGQVLIALAVAAGGSPLVGIVAAGVLMLCGLAMVLTDTINRA